MKRIFLLLTAGLLITAPGACNCEGEQPATPTKDDGAKPAAAQKAAETPGEEKPAAPEKPKAAEKPAAEGENKEDKAGETGEKADGENADADGEKAGEGDKADADGGKAGEGEKADADGEKADEGEKADGDGDKADADGETKDEASKKADKAAAEEISAGSTKNPMDEIKPGGVFKGPGAKAIQGTWIVDVSKAGLPTGLPDNIKKELKTLKKVSMTFDGKKVTIQHRKGKKNVVDYKVENDKGISLTLTTAAGPEAGAIQITFLDNDNILINATSFPVQMRGARKQ